MTVNGSGRIVLPFYVITWNIHSGKLHFVLLSVLIY